MFLRNLPSGGGGGMTDPYTPDSGVFEIDGRLYVVPPASTVTSGADYGGYFNTSFTPASGTGSFTGVQVLNTTNGVSSGISTALVVMGKTNTLTGGTVNLLDVGTTSSSYVSGYTSIFKISSAGVVTISGTLGLTSWSTTNTNTATKAGLGTTVASAIDCLNTTAAILNGQQYGPRIVSGGFGWGTTGGTSQAVQGGIWTEATQSTVPVATLWLGTSVAGGAWNSVVAIENGNVYGGTDGSHNLGKSSKRWANVYSNLYHGAPGSVSAPSFAFAGDSDTGMYTVGSGSLDFTCNAALTFTVATTGLTTTAAAITNTATSLFVANTFNTSVTSSSGTPTNVGNMLLHTTNGTTTSTNGVSVNTWIVNKTNTFTNGLVYALRVGSTSSTAISGYTDAFSILASTGSVTTFAYQFMLDTSGVTRFYIRAAGDGVFQINYYCVALNSLVGISLNTNYIRQDIDSGNTNGITIGQGKSLSTNSSVVDTFNPSTSINKFGTTITSVFTPSANAPNYAALQVSTTINGTSTGKAAALAVASKTNTLTGGTVYLLDVGTTTTDYFTGYTQVLSLTVDGALASTYLNANTTGIYGPASALATNATAGFTHIRTCPGIPTGVPSTIPTGQAAMVLDSTNQILYVYINGNWVSPVL